MQTPTSAAPEPGPRAAGPPAPPSHPQAMVPRDCRSRRGRPPGRSGRFRCPAFPRPAGVRAVSAAAAREREDAGDGRGQGRGERRGPRSGGRSPAAGGDLGQPVRFRPECCASLRNQVDSLLDQRADLTAQAQRPALRRSPVGTPDSSSDPAPPRGSGSRRRHARERPGDRGRRGVDPGGRSARVECFRGNCASSRRPAPAPRRARATRSGSWWRSPCPPRRQGLRRRPHRPVGAPRATRPALPPASDYDCAGGSGNGPEYTGFVTVTGSDPYGLDTDGDGVGCE